MRRAATAPAGSPPLSIEGYSRDQSGPAVCRVRAFSIFIRLLRPALPRDELISQMIKRNRPTPLPPIARGRDVRVSLRSLTIEDALRREPRRYY